MKFNIGVDIEMASRFRNPKKNFLRKFLSEAELEKLKPYSANRIAGIFSAKEAVIKACTPIERLHFENIEIFRKKDKSPYVVLRKCKKIKSEWIRISISHSKDFIVAAAILVKT